MSNNLTINVVSISACFEGTHEYDSHELNLIGEFGDGYLEDVTVDWEGKSYQLSNVVSIVISIKPRLGRSESKGVSPEEVWKSNQDQRDCIRIDQLVNVSACRYIWVDAFFPDHVVSKIANERLDKKKVSLYIEFGTTDPRSMDVSENLFAYIIASRIQVTTTFK